MRGTNYDAMLARGMESLGGFVRFGSHRSVIVKPNFVFDKKTHYPTTTDESSVLTTVQYLQKEGFKKITVADRRANRSNGRAGGKFEWSGLNDWADEGGFRTDSLMDDAEAPTVVVKDEAWAEMESIGVIRSIYEADLIINMPTIKRHSITHFTCSLKNMMGVLDVPTTQKMHLWGDENEARRKTMSDDVIVRRLCLTIAEAAMAVSPEMTVIDARKVLCANHGSIHTGEPKEAGCLILSGDQVAADVCASRLLGQVHEPFDPGPSIETITYASRLRMGVMDTQGFVLKEVSAS